MSTPVEDHPAKDPISDIRKNAIKSRKGFKAAFTRVAKGLEEEMELLRGMDETNHGKTYGVRALPQVLEDLELKFSKLDDCQQIILSSYDENAREEDPETSAIDPFYKLLRKLRREVDILTHDRASLNEASDGGFSQDGVDPQLAAVMGLQYDVTKDVRPFNGETPLTFPTFCSQWHRAEARLLSIGRGPVELLQELKRVLKDQALELVTYLPEVESNYARALAQLRKVYDDPILQVRSIIDLLMDMPVLEDTKSSLLKGYASMNQILQSLDGLNLTAENMSTIFFIALCERKLSKNTFKVWRKHVQAKADPNLALGADISREGFMEVLLKQVKLAPDHTHENLRTPTKFFKGQTPSTFLASQSTPCVFCQNIGHKALTCFKMHKMGYEDVESIRRTHKLCSKCLEPFSFNHQKSCAGSNCSIQNCARPTKHCKWTHNPHTTSIHVHQNSNIDHNQMEGPITPTISVAKANTVGQFRGILRTCIGFIKTPFGAEKLKVRFLLDAAAEQNLITRRCAESLGLDGPCQYLQINVAGGGRSKKTQEKHVQFHIEALDGSFHSNIIEATTIPEIAQAVKPVLIHPNHFGHLKSIPFTEEYPSVGSLSVDVLIGEPLFTHLCIGSPIIRGIQEPAAQNTKLGWVLCGAHSQSEKNQPSVNATVLLTTNSPVDLRSFWDQEHLGIILQDDALTVEEEEAMKLMSEVTKYNKEDKKWSTQLLWKRNPDNYISNNNFNRAKGVMSSVERRTKPEHQSMLNEAYQEMEIQGTSEKVPKDEIYPNDNRFVYYLETHPVLKESTTTKCRVVMNASSKDPTSKQSLNDLLYSGPNLLPNIAELQLRFRFGKVAISADITKMFLSIALHADQDSLRYLWRNFNTKEQATIFRMVAVTFGIKSSPFQAIWCLQQTAEIHQALYPNAADEIRTNLYMDDLITTSDNEQEAQVLLRDIVNILALGGFHAHKFASNSSIALKGLDQRKCLHGVVSTLGVHWNTENDTIQFNFLKDVIISHPTIQHPTKRTVLEIAASIYDPLGLVAPFTLKAKFIMQQLWISNVDWDAPLPEPQRKAWDQWINQVPCLHNKAIPRWVKCNVANPPMLVIFGDASQHAYGAAAYVVTTTDEGTVSSSLVFSKSRSAPLKAKLSIARLELLGALCAARIGQFVANAMKIPSSKCYFFTDSLLNLWRIQQGPNKWRQWVGNRIKAILANAPKNQWHFCPGYCNPADLVSRGANGNDLFQNLLWWEGPPFLKEPPKTWPSSKSLIKTEEMLQEDQLEEKKVVRPFTVMVTQFEAPFAALLERSSSWTKLTRTTGWILRFCSVLKDRIHKIRTDHRRPTRFPNINPRRPLSISELNQAENFWFKMAQTQSFANELETLQDHGRINKQSSLTCLQPLLADGLIRSESRLRLSRNINERAKFPIILPKHSRIVELFVLHLHRLYLHCGTEQLLACIKAKFHIIGNRREVKRITFSCKAPRCRKVVPLDQKMGALPPERSSDSMVCFETVGLDFFGPLFVNHRCQQEECPHNQQASKVYGCVFSCFTSRAIHLELVTDLSTETFLLAFRRFMARRGIPRKCYSDNAKTFKMADKESNTRFPVKVQD